MFALPLGPLLVSFLAMDFARVGPRLRLIGPMPRKARHCLDYLWLLDFAGGETFAVGGFRLPLMLLQLLCPCRARLLLIGHDTALALHRKVKFAFKFVEV